MPPLSSGAVIDGSFTLLRPIGEGGMGEVWLAREDALGREVALKLMIPSGSRTREERFGREARALAVLDNPSILPVLRSGTDPATGRHYFATPAVLLSPSEITRVCDEVLHCPYPRGHAEDASHAESGGRDAPTARPPLVTRHPSLVPAAAPRPLPLSTLLDAGKTLPQAAVLRIARDLAGALAAAHAAGILHRDVKPSNILFDASGRALLADFGLAKFLEVDAVAGGSGGAAPRSLQTISLDESGSRKFLGSPAYAAPEQFRDGATLTPAIDWYSLGAVLYEALTGGRPRSLRPPSSFDPAHVSRGWDPFLRDLLEPDPARRLADPATIARRLDAIVRAIDPALSRRRRAVRTALVAAAVLAAVAVVAHFHAKPDPAVETHPETAETPLVARPLSLVTATAPRPPRLDSVWQGENRGPLQLLGVFRLAPVERLADEALSSADPETLRLLREGDEAWASWRGNPDALLRAIRAWTAAVARIEEAGGAGGTGKASAVADGAGGSGESPDHLVLRSFALVRLAWTYVANAERGGADEPFRKALAAIDPLVEADADRYGPLRSWLLSERAYMECMEGRFIESADDLREAGVLWARYVMPLGDPGCEAQCYVVEASLGGMFRTLGETDGAILMTYHAIDALEPFLFPPAAPDGANPPDEPPEGAASESSGRLALLDLLAGCHYRLGEMHRETGARLESIAAFRRAADLWRDLFKTHGERYRGSCVQALGRLGMSLTDAERLEEAIAAWEETRNLFSPLLASDPKRYASEGANLLENIASASRALGDEERASALESEAAELRASP